jgi:uncharacterized protein (DUF486 family)
MDWKTPGGKIAAVIFGVFMGYAIYGYLKLTAIPDTIHVVITQEYKSAQK